LAQEDEAAKQPTRVLTSSKMDRKGPCQILMDETLQGNIKDMLRKGKCHKMPTNFVISHYAFWNATIPSGSQVLASIVSESKGQALRERDLD